jgi:hypothetical protein
MNRTFAVFAAVAVAVVLIFVGLGRSGVVDMKKPMAAVPAGAVPHGGAEKPITDQTTGSTRR